MGSNQCTLVLHALESGCVTEEHLLAEIGEILSGKASGRRSANEVTIYKSLGNIVQDLAAAVHCVQAVGDAADYTVPS
jgi:ornithine cyclodeaminase